MIFLKKFLNSINLYKNICYNRRKRMDVNEKF
jgi:hypothetical protein